RWVNGFHRKGNAQIAYVFGGHPARRARAELCCDETLPQIGRLHHMHVTVEYLESILSHRASPSFLDHRIRQRSSLIQSRVSTLHQESVLTTKIRPRGGLKRIHIMGLARVKLCTKHLNSESVSTGKTQPMREWFRVRSLPYSLFQSSSSLRGSQDLEGQALQ